jgi:DNA-binding NarL/FixJ family response regulator
MGAQKLEALKDAGRRTQDRQAVRLQSVARLHRLGLSVAEIARALGISYAAAKRALAAQGLTT